MSLYSRWSQYGARLTVILTLAVALLSVLTGIANIGAQSVVGPLAEFIPPAIQRTAGFTGALTGFLILISAFGLRRGLRVAWYSTVVLLPITALQGLMQSSPLSFPLIVLSLLALPNVLANRRHFDRELSFSISQLTALAAIVGAQIYGTVGTYALRDEFANITTLVDAFYYTLVTASTVGYGDAAPTTQSARLFGMSVIVIGTTSFALALGTVLGPAIEARLSRALGRMTDSQLELLSNHILILGYGDLTEAILEEFSQDIRDGTEILVITPDSDNAQHLAERDFNVLTGDPSDEETLRKAHIEEARAILVATNNDAEDALSVLTARDLNTEGYIVAAATNRENIGKLKRAGADTVISPQSIAGEILVRSALNRQSMDEMDELTTEFLDE
ncbi:MULTISPECIES: NAD-binding protein [Halorussus]|uniref:NAD-binding protein n=2 Tax=Halorussus TaxID=1070314 RepID=A0A8U0I2C0_9EURY|nr:MULTISPECIES: NAD-binding protein [Halorussus]UPV77066.1 NAD-binding protein [Halorussus limi]USZ78442.1 NAD-binding protein [Halorussus vallis]